MSRGVLVMNNIILAGFMGTGKTTVGRAIAKKLARRFIDSDQYITSITRKPIPQIFSDHGEAHFRQLEAQTALELAKLSDVVIATGGGMFLNWGNYERLADSGIVVCLNAPPEIIQARIGDDQGRPLASNWATLYQQRQPIYAQIPHQIETAKQTPEEIAEQVIQLWQKLT
jgi:shikimate kinase